MCSQESAFHCLTVRLLAAQAPQLNQLLLLPLLLLRHQEVSEVVPGLYSALCLCADNLHELAVAKVRRLLEQVLVSWLHPLSKLQVDRCAVSYSPPHWQLWAYCVHSDCQLPKAEKLRSVWQLGCACCQLIRWVKHAPVLFYHLFVVADLTI